MGVGVGVWVVRHRFRGYEHFYARVRDRGRDYDHDYDRVRDGDDVHGRGGGQSRRHHDHGRHR